jgi:hypothetical protein
MTYSRHRFVRQKLQAVLAGWAILLAGMGQIPLWIHQVVHHGGESAVSSAESTHQKSCRCCETSAHSNGGQLNIIRPKYSQRHPKPLDDVHTERTAESTASRESVSITKGSQIELGSRADCCSHCGLCFLLSQNAGPQCSAPQPIGLSFVKASLLPTIHRKPCSFVNGLGARGPPTQFCGFRWKLS